MKHILWLLAVKENDGETVVESDDGGKCNRFLVGGCGTWNGEMDHVGDHVGGISIQSNGGGATKNAKGQLVKLTE